MKLALLVYLISFLNAVAGVFTFFCLVLGLGAIIMTIAFFVTMDAKEGSNSEFLWHKRAKTMVWLLWPLLFVGMVTVAALPDKKTSYMMVGAYTAQTLGQSQAVTETGSKVLTLVNTKLDDYIAADKKAANNK